MHRRTLTALAVCALALTPACGDTKDKASTTTTVSDEAGIQAAATEAYGQGASASAIEVNGDQATALVDTPGKGMTSVEFTYAAGKWELVSAPNVASATDPASDPAAPPPPPATPQCIDQFAAGDAGKCNLRDGRSAYLAKQGGTAKIKSLTVSIESTYRTDSIRDSSISAVANGTYLVVKLAVTNRTSTPQQVGENQTSLLIDRNAYSEDFEAENGADQQSFVWNSEDIQPDETVTGDVVYDLPPKAIKKLDKPGTPAAVAMSGFGDDEGTGQVALVPLPTP